MALRKAHATALVWLVMSALVLSVKKTVKVTIESGGVKGQRKSYSNRTSTPSILDENPCEKEPVPADYVDKCQVLNIKTSNEAKVLNWPSDPEATEEKNADKLCPIGYYCSQNRWRRNLWHKCRQSLGGKPCGGESPPVDKKDGEVELQMKLKDGFCPEGSVCNKATWQCMEYSDNEGDLNFGWIQAANVLATCNCWQGLGSVLVKNCCGEGLICGRQERCKVGLQQPCVPLDLTWWKTLTLGTTVCAQGTYADGHKGIGCYPSFLDKPDHRSSTGTGPAAAPMRCCVKSSVGLDETHMEAPSLREFIPPQGNVEYCCSGCGALWVIGGKEYLLCTYQNIKGMVITEQPVAGPWCDERVQ